MPQVKTGDRIVVQVTENGDGNWQVDGAPAGFQTITAALFSDNDLIHGFLLHENDEDWEVYDGDEAADFLQILNVASPVILQRPATPHDSSNSGNRLSNTDTGTHTLAVEIGAATLARVFRETNPSVLTFTGGDATPSVEGYRYCKTQGSTAITAFDSMGKGQFFLVMAGDAAIDITDNASIETLDNKNLTLQIGQCAWFIEEGGVAKQVSGQRTLKSDLASTDASLGSSLVGYDGGTTVKAALDLFKFFSIAEADVGGTSDAITLTLTNGKALSEGMVFNFLPSSENTGAVTIDYNSGGVVALVDSDGNALGAGDLKPTAPVLIRYDSNSSTYRLVSGSGSGSGVQKSSNQATESELSDQSNSINTSGKSLGKFVLDTTNNRIYFALGSGATDAWRPFDDMSGIGSDVTPS